MTKKEKINLENKIKGLESSLDYYKARLEESNKEISRLNDDRRELQKRHEFELDKIFRIRDEEQIEIKWLHEMVELAITGEKTNDKS